MAMRADDIPRLTEHQLVAVVELALQHPVRTEHQQDQLLQLCSVMDDWSEPFRSWTAEAVSSWKAKPCGECGAPIDIESRSTRCVDCSAMPLPCEVSL